MRTILETSDIKEHTAHVLRDSCELFVFRDGSVLALGADTYAFDTRAKAMEWAEDAGLTQIVQWLFGLANPA